MSYITMSVKSVIKQKMYLIEITVGLSSEATKLISLVLQKQAVCKGHQALLFSIWTIKNQQINVLLSCSVACPDQRLCLDQVSCTSGHLLGPQTKCCARYGEQIWPINIYYNTEAAIEEFGT